MSVILKHGTLILKDPDADLPYEFDWGEDWLGETATLAGSAWAIAPVTTTPLVNAGDSIVGGTVAKVRLTGGLVGTTYRVTNRITTNESPARIDDRTLLVKVKER